jgi:hypothetical protein
MEGDKQDLRVLGAGETSKNGGLDAVAAADSLISNDGRPSQAQSNAAPIVLQEQEGLESLLRGMLTALQRIESLLEGQQKDLGPRQESMRKDNGIEEAIDTTKPVGQQEIF